MTNIKIKLSLLLLYSAINVNGQGYVGGDTGKGTQISTVPGGIVQEMNLSEPKTEGNTYLFQNWVSADITLSDGKLITGLPIRYDLYNNGLEIKTSNNIRFLSAIRIKEFNYYNELGIEVTLINPLSIVNINPEIPSSFLKIEGQGKWSLYQQKYVKLIKSNYNAALDMGNRNNKMIIESQFILSNDKVAFIVKGNKRNFSRNFEDPELVYSFLKDNKLNLNELHDLKSVLVFLNSQ
ncbi:MAG TPA: hypothetical protein PKL31_17805 [Fulvivirga sp.]|nr:hypothetical protein [Fulvivirga sp.]